MTGYGKAEALLETGKITVEVRSLNGKTADISIKTSMLPKDKEMAVRAKMYSHDVKDMMDKVRENADNLEMLIDDEMWTLPKYRELLFF